jgi:hypothetical protein
MKRGEIEERRIDLPNFKGVLSGYVKWSVLNRQRSVHSSLSGSGAKVLSELCTLVQRDGCRCPLAPSCEGRPPARVQEAVRRVPQKLNAIL